MPAPENDASEGLPTPTPQIGSDGGRAAPSPADVVSALPPQIQEAIQHAESATAAISVISAAFSQYQGPLPPASEMRAYEDVLPGSANRILQMAERQAAHRQQLEKTAVDGGSRRSWWGLWLGFGISVIVIAASVVLVLAGHNGAGIALASIDIATLAGVFVYGRIDQRRERVQKDAATHALRPPPPAQPGSN